MNTYQYQILRFLPDRVSGEFVNVGLIMFDKKDKALLGKVVHTTTRIHSLFPAISSRLLLSHLKQIEHRIESIAKQLKNEFQFEKMNSLEELTKEILPKDDSSLFFTETFSLLDVDVNSAFADLYSRLIETNIHTDEFHHLQDKEVWSHKYRQYFEKHGLVNKLQPHTIKTSSDKFTFDHAIKNEVWHCFEAVSFDLVKEDSIKNKVYKWWGKIHELSENKEEFKVYLLAQMPQSNPQLEHFIEKKLNVSNLKEHKNFSKVLDEQEAEKVIRKIKEHLK